MTRIQIELSEEEVAQIDQLMMLTGIRTRKEYFNNALTLMEWAINEKRVGHGIASIEDSTQSFRELVMPALQKVKPISESNERSGKGQNLRPKEAERSEGLSTHSKAHF